MVITTIVRPVRGLADTMVSLADQNLGVVIPASDRRDEVGLMAKAVATFKEKMTLADRIAADQRKEQEARNTRIKKREALTDKFGASAADTINVLAAAAGTLQHTAGAMADGAVAAARQAQAAVNAAGSAANNVSTVAAATEQLAASIQEITRQVAESTNIASQAVQEASQTSTTIRTLAEAAERIGEVVNLINDIAAQTNLLALNATIEAARAGDAGKGFAVVASEVKNLANQTAKATENIISQISSMQTATNDAVQAIGRIDKTIGQMNHISTAIAAAVEQQGAATQEIARNVEAAAQGTSEVSQNISGMNMVVSETRTSAADVLDKATELGQKAESLRGDVKQFLDEIRSS
jgi:methyl-accepting chemotaxis protein